MTLAYPDLQPYNFRYLQLPADLGEASLAEVYPKLRELLAEVAISESRKFVLDLAEGTVDILTIGELIFKVLEVCNLLNVQVRFISRNDFARLYEEKEGKSGYKLNLFITALNPQFDSMAKITLYKDLDSASADDWLD